MTVQALQKGVGTRDDVSSEARDGSIIEVQDIQFNIPRKQENDNAKLSLGGNRERLDGLETDKVHHMSLDAQATIESQCRLLRIVLKR